MIIEKIESTLIIKCAKRDTNEFIDWLEKMGKKLKIDILYFIKKKIFSNKIRIVMVGIEKDVNKLEHKIKMKLLYG